VSVTVSRAVDAGILVEVADRGLGISADDLRAANERLALGGEVTSETAKRMGLFVVGRLARRHEATVLLRTTDALNSQPGVTASVYLPGALIAPLTEIVEALDDPPEVSFGDESRPAAEHVRIPARELWIEVDGGAATPTTGSDASSHNGSTLPKRSPGASGVNGFAGPEDGRIATEPTAALEQGLGGQPTSNPFAYFTNRSTPEAPHSQSTPAAQPEQPNIASESSPIFERMVSEWLMDPTAPESRDRAWATAADDGWAAAAKAVEQKPQRHTESGLPIRERGARLVPGHARTGPDAAAVERRNPAAAGDVLSRALAGVRSGRAESSAAQRRIEGDE
jgi:hypothetical protein